MRSQSHLAQGLAVVLVYVLAGSFTGIAEVSILMLVPGSPTTGPSLRHLFPAAIVYGLLWGALGLCGLGVVTALGYTRHRLEHDVRVRLHVAAALGSSAFVILGGYANLHYLPRYFALISLGFDALLLAVIVLLSLLLYRALSWPMAPIRFLTRTCSQPRSLLGVLAVVLTVAMLLAPRQPAANSAGLDGGAVARGECPNVLLVIIDTLRADHLSCYGYDRPTSPNIDRFVQRAFLFENAIAQSSKTVPSTASIVTGLHPSSHGCHTSHDSLPDSGLDLSSLMEKHGHATGLFSDNPHVSPHFGYRAQHVYVIRLDFTEIIIGHALSRAAPRSDWAAAAYKGLSRLFVACSQDRDNLGHATESAPELTGDFLRWLDGLGGRPFFAHIQYMDPHAPYVPPPPFDRMFDGEYRGPTAIEPPYSGYWFWPFRLGKELRPDVLGNMVARYDGEIAHVDREFGALLSGLEQRGFSENTLVILTSDHGEEFFEHGGYSHGNSLFAELTHVPLIVGFPGDARGPGRHRELVAHIDVAPTVLTVCGIPIPSTFQGQSFAGAVTGGDSPPKSRTLLSEVRGNGGEEAWALSDGSYKIVSSRSPTRAVRAVYDLRSDADEQHDLAPQHAALASELEARLEAARHEITLERREAPKVEINEALEERLRALGYLR